MNKILRGFVVISTVLLALVMFSFLIVGIVYTVYYQYTTIVSQYTKHQCVLTEGTVKSSCFNKYYIPLWKVFVPDFNSTIYSAATDPLNIQNTFQEAQNQLAKYPKNVTIPCYCNNKMFENNVYPNFTANAGCQVLTYCFVDTKATKASIDDNYYYNLGNVLAIIGGIALASKIIIMMPLLACIMCENPRKKQYTSV